MFQLKKIIVDINNDNDNQFVFQLISFFKLIHVVY